MARQGVVVPTIRLSDALWGEFEEACVELTVIRGKPVMVPEVVRYLLETNKEKGISEMISIEQANK
jgi:hypothetical protein